MQNNNPGNGEMLTIEGTVDRVVFSAPDTGYTVARINTEDQPDPVTVVGKMASLQPGQRGKFQGQWVDHPRFGRQFKSEGFQQTAPATLTGIEKYLGSGMIKGIGKAFARRVVEKFGLDTLKIIENKPERLREVEGIGRKRLEQIITSVTAQRKIQDVMVFLQGCGLGPQRAVKIYRTYGDDSVAILKQNPYRLATEIWGIGFKLADTFALKMGFAPDSPQRAEAVLIHTLTKASDQGHCYLPKKDLNEKCHDATGISLEILKDALDQLKNSGTLVTEEDRVYLGYLHRFEVECADKLNRMMDAPAKSTIDCISARMADAMVSTEIQLSEHQQQALTGALTSKVFIITGGPGVGKTSILKVLVKILESAGQAVGLCAPTGRAAKRMTQSIGREAKTIHRMLNYRPGDGGGHTGEVKKVTAPYLIVDEVSMVDLNLFHVLLSAMDPRTRLILVGDPDQLPSVGPGQVLADLVGSPSIPRMHLSRIYRQKAGSLIIENAHRINRGSMPVLKSPDSQGMSDFYFIECDQPPRTQEIILDMVANRIPRRFGLDSIDDVQVISPMRRRVLGAHELNAHLQEVLNPGTDSIRGLRLGDKVMQLRNNYELGVYNGDMGRVLSVDPRGESLSVDFDGTIVEYDLAQTDEIRPAYATTVHKSQGSEFPAVVMPFTPGISSCCRETCFTRPSPGQDGSWCWWGPRKRCLWQ